MIDETGTRILYLFMGLVVGAALGLTHPRRRKKTIKKKFCIWINSDGSCAMLNENCKCHQQNVTRIMCRMWTRKK